MSLTEENAEAPVYGLFIHRKAKQTVLNMKSEEPNSVDYSTLKLFSKRLLLRNKEMEEFALEFTSRKKIVKLYIHTLVA